MTFGRLVRKLREEAELTQAALAERSGVPLRTIQGWEQDHRCPVSPDFFKIVKVLGVSADAFNLIREPSARTPRPKGRPKKIEGLTSPIMAHAEKKPRAQKRKK